MKIYFKAMNGEKEVFLLLKSENNHKSTCILMGRIDDKEYSALIDESLYTHIAFRTELDKSMYIPLTSLANGFYITKNGELDFYIHSTLKYGTVEYYNLPYRKEQKRIVVWLPEGYDEKKTYNVLYMLDAQNLFDRRQSYFGEIWSADITALSAIKKYNKRFIIVGIYNDDGEKRRFEDLTPAIGDVTEVLSGKYPTPHGDVFAEFFSEMLVPFIKENYNIFDENNAIIGSSCGGLMAFYLGLENLEHISFIGSFSPAFLVFDNETWLAYLEKFDFKSRKNLPFIYLYTGANDELEKHICFFMAEMEKTLEKVHYNSDKISSITDNEAIHNEVYWRYYLPGAIEKWAKTI